jgi:hypothetical protein
VVVWLHIVGLVVSVYVLVGSGMCWMGGEEDGHVDVSERICLFPRRCGYDVSCMIGLLRLTDRQRLFDTATEGKA